MNPFIAIVSWISRVVWLATWRSKMCPGCANLECVGNYGPCYSCCEGDNFQEPMPPEELNERSFFGEAALLAYQASVPHTMLYVASRGSDKVCCIGDVYVTDVVLNGRRLLRYRSGNPAGWLPECQSDEKERYDEA